MLISLHSTLWGSPVNVNMARKEISILIIPYSEFLSWGKTFVFGRIQLCGFYFCSVEGPHPSTPCNFVTLIFVFGEKFGRKKETRYEVFSIMKIRMHVLMNVA